MTWYSTPIQPLDPVVVSQQPKPNVRYMRDNFAATGQNSYVQPPAQDQSMWQALTNVMPITQGRLNQRWGYNPFATFSGTVVPIRSISYTAGNSFATLTFYNLNGFGAPTAITISGTSNSLFDGTFPIITIGRDIALYYITIPFTNGSNQTSVGGVITSSVPLAPNRLYNYQSDALGTRAIIAAGLPGVRAFTESGSIYNANVFTPAAANGIIRSVTSRNYQYFVDGDNALNTNTHLTGDSLKWNGASTGGVTNIGINVQDVNQNSTSGGGGTGITLGPNTGTVATDVGGTTPNPWTNDSGIFSNNPATPAYVQVYEANGIPNFTSDTLELTGFGFTAFPAPYVQGIQVAFTYLATPFNNVVPPYDIVATVQLLKNGALVGTPQTFNVTVSNNVIRTQQIGSADQLWGTSWVPSDITNANFGVSIQVAAPNGFHFGSEQAYSSGVQFNCSYVSIVVTGRDNPGTSGNSGNGVGIVNELAVGGCNLAIGRTYYLVGNNSLTGHFSDLSIASISTGACTNSYFDLILATFNDPQVDYKYLLATADGGDPSILYQVPVIVKGTQFNITSWATTGTSVTFTGTYAGAQYTAGESITVTGLVIGDYLNGNVYAVTSSTTTSFTANYVVPSASATEDGLAGPTIFAIPNATTEVLDSTPDPTLVTDQTMLFTDQFANTYGVALNTPPPAGELIIKHQGRLWMAGVPGATHSVYFSKSVNELTLPDGFIAGKYEEAWPGSNYFDVSDGAESVAGLMSDGTTLYIGTQNHIRRLLGNAPSNFQEPQIVHPNVGLLNQEVWQFTFMQGAPSGSVWVTPDLKVIQSDFNTYVDIGTPVQDILNNAQSTASTLAHAAYVADGEYDLYILALPYNQSTYCDVHLVFDLRARQWFVWYPASGSLSLMYNVTQQAASQWLFINGAGTAIDIYANTATTDNGTSIPITATTTWMNLGEPTRRKVLNEIQVYGNTEMTMTVNGANNLADFSSPRSIVYNRTLRQSPFGYWVLYLTGARSRHRYYQFTFQTANGQIPFLGSYSIALTPLDDI